MASRALQEPYAKTAQKIALSPLKILRGTLIFVGKPFYYLLSYFFISILYAASFALKSINTFWRKTIQLVKGLTGIKLPRPKIQIRISKRLLFLLLLIIVFIFSARYYVFRGLPSPKELTTREQEVSTKIYDRNGVLLYKIYKNKNRTLVGLSEVPLHVRQATLAAEDAEFYQHLGFSLRGIGRALVRNLKTGKLSGGSTITQQLVKNALLTPEKTLTRKIKELVLSIEVEATFTKDKILEMYLNEVSYGGTAYGIEEASRVYFGKEVGKLDLAEAALLAGLPKAPSRYSPFGAEPELAQERQKEVLKLMVINGYITQAEAKAAEEESLHFAPNQTEIKAPHFVMYVRKLLAERYGEEMVEKGGLEVITSLDYATQKMAEDVVMGEVDQLAGYHATNGAALVLAPQTGEILVMVGSKNYFDQQIDGNVNLTTSLRQPGSSIKVVNYSYALAHGYTPASILDDSPVTFSVPGQPPYVPKNYDGAYRGRLSLRSALAESRNIPAVKVLASYGVAKMLEQGQKMGITTWDEPSRFGLSLTLGGGDVKLIELARVYATIANLGKIPTITPILGVRDYQGRVLEENHCASSLGNHPDTVYAAEATISPCNQEQVLDPRIAYQIIDILKDNNARAPAFGYHSSLAIDGHPEVAAKTGTSNNLKDNLTFGFTPDYLVAAWVGNNDASPMTHLASGITGAAPIFNHIMANLLAGKESSEWLVPDGVVKTQICSYTGTLPCQGCPTRSEWFLEETKPTKACLPETITGGQILPEAASTSAN